MKSFKFLTYLTTLFIFFTSMLHAQMPEKQKIEVATNWVKHFCRYFHNTPSGALLRVVDKQKKESFLDFLTTCLAHYAQYDYVAKDPTKLDAMMKKIAKQEKKYAHSHYAFYHGTNTFITFIQDVISVLMYKLENKQLPKYLPPLRIPYKDFEKYNCIHDLRDKINDCNGDTRKVWLAVTPTPFNGVVPDSYSESPSTYFYNPVSKPGGGAILLCGGLNYENMLKSIFQHFGIEDLFNQETGKQICNKLKSIYSKNKNDPIAAYHNEYEGWLYQLFIPKNLAQTYVAPCFLRGDLYQESTQTITFLEDYRLWPEKTVYPTKEDKYKNRSSAWYASYVQCRILLHPKVFLDPMSDIKILRHRIWPREKNVNKNYWKWLYDWAENIKHEKNVLLASNVTLVRNTSSTIKSIKKIDDEQHKQLIAMLLQDLELYKINPNGFHAGNLLDHLIWTARTIDQWFEQKYFWVAPLPQGKWGWYRENMILAAFLHDIGKAGDLLYQFASKPDHQKISFYYLTGQRLYQIKNAQAIDLGRIFSSPEQQSFVALLARMHHELGKMMTLFSENKYYTEESKTLRNQTYDTFFRKIKDHAHIASYNNGSIDYNLITCIFALGAADIKSALPAQGNIPYLNTFLHTDVSVRSTKSIHQTNGDHYQQYKYEKDGKFIFDEVLEYFKTKYSSQL